MLPVNHRLIWTSDEESPLIISLFLLFLEDFGKFLEN